MSLTQLVKSIKTAGKKTFNAAAIAGVLIAPTQIYAADGTSAKVSVSANEGEGEGEGERSPHQTSPGAEGEGEKQYQNQTPDPAVTGEGEGEQYTGPTCGVPPFLPCAEGEGEGAYQTQSPVLSGEGEGEGESDGSVPILRKITVPGPVISSAPAPVATTTPPVAPECPPTVVCPTAVKKVVKKATPKRKRKATCDTLYEGRGVCASEYVAGELGLTDKTAGHCKGSAKVECYDAAPVGERMGTLLALDEDGYVSIEDWTNLLVKIDALKNDLGEYATNNHVDSKFDPLDSRVGSLESDRLTQLERFAVSVVGEQCREDYAGLQGFITEARTAEIGMNAATSALSTYKENSGLTDTDSLSAVDPRSLVNRGLDSDAMVSLLGNVERATASYRQAIANAEAAASVIRNQGCGYEEPRETILEVSVGGHYNGESFGYEAGLAVLAPVGEKGYVGVQATVSPFELSEKVDEGREESRHLPGGVTQTSQQTDTTTRNGGVGLVGAVKTGGGRVYGSVGAAWMTESMDRTLHHFDETIPMSHSEDNVALEASVGYAHSVAGPVKVGVEGRLNTAGYNSLGAVIKADF